MGRNLGSSILGVALAVILVLCLPLPADSEAGTEIETDMSYSELRVGFIQQIDSLNPYVGINDVSHFFYSLVYDSLEGIGDDLEAVPNLAKSQWAVPVGYDSDPNLTGMTYGSVWQYNLSDTAHWSDGEPFTADDVVYNLWLHYNPTFYDSMWAYHPYSYYMHSAWKIDDQTVRVSYWDRITGDPMPVAFADRLQIPMLPKHLLERLQGGYSYIGMNWTGIFPESISPGKPIVGTGPFTATTSILSEWLAGSQVTLVRNPDSHWSTDYGKQVRFEKLTMWFYLDVTSMALALKNSDIDVAAYPPTAYNSIKSDVESGTLKNVTVFSGPKISQYFTYVGFSMAQSGHNPSRLDPVIRQAMHMATNKAYITENMYMEYATPGSTLVPPINSYWHYEPTADERLDYNITMAADLLEANGYMDIDSDGVRECTISSKAVQMGWVAEGTSLEYEMFVRKEYPEEKDIAMFLRNQLQQIGVLVQYMVVEEITLAQIAYSYNYDTLIWYWSADPDPNYILFVQSRNAWSGWSDNKYTNAAFEENYTNSVKSLDEAQRKGYVDNCQKIHYNDSAYVVLAYPDQTYAWRTDTFSGWGNWSTHPGRSLDNYWSGNPLFFDLTPEAPSDTDPPSASAGPDMKVKAGTTVVFNGGYSEDNVGIVNFTWSFTYGGEEIEIYGLISSWKFDETGIYPVTLRVEDLAGLTDNDTATVTVEAKGNVLTDYWWIAPIAVGAVAVAATAVLLLRRRS